MLALGAGCSLHMAGWLLLFGLRAHRPHRPNQSTNTIVHAAAAGMPGRLSHDLRAQFRVLHAKKPGNLHIDSNCTTFIYQHSALYSIYGKKY